MGVMGAIAGSQKDKSKTTSSIQLGAASGAEIFASDDIMSQYKKFAGMVDGGPGQADVERGTSSAREFADMLKQYQEGGYRPSDQDISSSNTLASQLFNPQRVAMQQAFSDQSVEANRRAALLGRSMNDPILAAKLAQEQTRQSSMLEANQGAWSTDYAMQQPGMRLGFAQQRTNVLGGLASQAMANRQALLGMGQSIQGNERNFRLQQATRTGESESGGGLKGGIEGHIAGSGMAISSFSSLMGGMGGMGGGGGGGGTNYQMPRGMPAPNPQGVNMSGYQNYATTFQNTAPGQIGPWGGQQAGGGNYPSLYSGMNRY